MNMMNMMRAVELVWDDLLDAFENTDPDIVYFLDKNSGEIFFVPIDYEDDDFWDEMERLSVLKEQLTNDRVRSWLEEHDIFTFGGSC